MNRYMLCNLLTLPRADLGDFSTVEKKNKSGRSRKSQEVACRSKVPLRPPPKRNSRPSKALPALDRVSIGGPHKAMSSATRRSASLSSGLQLSSSLSSISGNSSMPAAGCWLTDCEPNFTAALSLLWEMELPTLLYVFVFPEGRRLLS